MRRLFIFLAIMALFSPIFGVWLANLIGYHEPLDVAADLINEMANKTLGHPVMNDTRYQMNWTPFIDYTVPGLPDWAGYIVAAYIGLTIYLIVLLVVKRVKRSS